MDHVLCDVLIKISPSIESSPAFKKEIVRATAEYQSEIEDL